MKKILLLCGIIISVSGSVVAEEALPFAAPVLQKQFIAKQLYREAWEADNAVPLSSIEALEYLQQGNSGLDADTLLIAKRGTALLKKMHFGLKDADRAQDSTAIRQNPVQVLSKISDSTTTDATSAEALEVIDIAGASERLKEKVFRDKSLGRQGYQINIDAF